MNSIRKCLKVALNGNNLHLSSLECTRKRQIGSLLSHAFRDLPFSISVLTDTANQFSLFIVGAVGGS